MSQHLVTVLNMAVTTRAERESGEADGLFAVFDATLAAAAGVSNRPPPDMVDRALADVTSHLESLVAVMDLLPDSVAVAQLSRCEQRLSSARLLRVARAAGSTGDSAIDRRRARNIMSSSDVASRSVNRDARRAAAVANNQHLGDQLATGSIRPDAIDALGRAANDENGQIPVDLVNAVGGLTPDQTTQVVDRYIEDTADPEDVEAQYLREMAARRAHRYSVPADGGRPALEGIGIEGPKAVIARLWSQVCGGADARYQAAGGRNRQAAGHQPLDHRRFDTLAEILAGGAVGAGSGRPSVVVTVDAGDLFDDPDKPLSATQLGAGPISQTLLSEYLAAGGPPSVLISSCEGVPMWYGRARRRASSGQFLALAVRDRGCVLCRATIDRCAAHHLMPWTAPGRGKTDINEMALLCQRCHRDLHQRNHTLYATQAPNGPRIWATRPATPQETPARPPQYQQRE